jgi:hypothetical protein
MNVRLRAAGLAATAAGLVVSTQVFLGLWSQPVLADLPNCAEYPSACANYNHQPSGTPGIVIAGVIVLAAVVVVAAGLSIVILRRRRRARVSPPPPPQPPDWSGLSR